MRDGEAPGGDLEAPAGGKPLAGHTRGLLGVSEGGGAELRCSPGEGLCICADIRYNGGIHPS